MTEQFNFDFSQQAKEQGMRLAADNQPSALAMAREIAEEIARRNGRVSADDVGREMKARGYDETGPWAGSIFSQKQWEFTGLRIRSKRVSNHGRELKVWRLR